MKSGSFATLLYVLGLKFYIFIFRFAVDDIIGAAFCEIQIGFDSSESAGEVSLGDPGLPDLFIDVFHEDLIASYLKVGFLGCSGFRGSGRFLCGCFACGFILCRRLWS